MWSLNRGGLLIDMVSWAGLYACILLISCKNDLSKEFVCICKNVISISLLSSFILLPLIDNLIQSFLVTSLYIYAFQVPNLAKLDVQ